MLGASIGYSFSVANKRGPVLRNIAVLESDIANSHDFWKQLQWWEDQNGTNTIGFIRFECKRRSYHTINTFLLLFRFFQKTKVLLNVYDLSPANDYLVPVGFGLHHCGVEIMGREYSFGSGSGIFEGPPGEAPGAKFRFQLEMGAYNGGSKELNQALDELRNDFGTADYNLVRKNCNHFCNALVWRLLQRSIPAYINRWADIGNCCSCLLPKDLLEDSPVGGSGNRSSSSSSSSFQVPTSASMNRGKSNQPASFTGQGYSLGGSGGAGKESEGLLSNWTRSTHTAQTTDDLVDRREKARKAALARLERNQQTQIQQSPPSSQGS